MAGTLPAGLRDPVQAAGASVGGAGGVLGGTVGGVAGTVGGTTQGLTNTVNGTVRDVSGTAGGAVQGVDEHDDERSADGARTLPRHGQRTRPNGAHERDQGGRSTRSRRGPSVTPTEQRERRIRERSRRRSIHGVSRPRDQGAPPGGDAVNKHRAATSDLGL